MVRSEVLTHNQHPGDYMEPLACSFTKPLFCSFRIINEKPPESFLCIGNSIRKHVADFSQEGLRTSVGYALGYLSMTKYIEGELWLTPKEKPRMIGDIDTKAHLRKKDGWGFCIFSGIELLQALHVITWTRQARFIGTGGTRCCTACGKEQIATIYKGFAHLSGKPSYIWPTDKIRKDLCTDPDCLSHALDEAVDPTYQAPRDELRAICEAEENKTSELRENVQQLLDKAGLLPLKSPGDR